MKKILKFLLSSSNWIDWLFSETKDGIASRGGKCHGPRADWAARVIVAHSYCSAAAQDL